jgi:diphosphomevalonate decarboxylase
MTESDFLPKNPYLQLAPGHIACQSPSNIALVKYWGKYGTQLPCNASISFTLSHCATTTKLSYRQKESSEFEFEVLLDGDSTPSFVPKIQKFFERIERYVPFLRKYRFTIDTSNSFPHSSGIASSASGMSALAVCLVGMERRLLGQADGDLTGIELQKASFLARLGSGSACRSLQGPLVVWGEHPRIEGSSNIMGVPYPCKVHENFVNYQDTILLVDTGEKQVSSTVGHELMNGNPYAEARFRTANANLSKLIGILKDGDVSGFVEIVESEALQLHGMMMASEPYYILMKPNTLEIIQHIWNYRKETGSKLCFTLDAGANVHVLYPFIEKTEVQRFIEARLAPFCKDGRYIHDAVGQGAGLL